MKKALFLSVLLAFAAVLAVGQSKAPVTEKAIKTECVVQKNDVDVHVVNLNVDAEFFPFVFELATGSVAETIHFTKQYSVLNNDMDVSRGPPEFRNKFRC